MKIQTLTLVFLQRRSPSSVHLPSGQSAGSDVSGRLDRPFFSYLTPTAVLWRPPGELRLTLLNSSGVKSFQRLTQCCLFNFLYADGQTAVVFRCRNFVNSSSFLPFNLPTLTVVSLGPTMTAYVGVINDLCVTRAGGCC